MLADIPDTTRVFSRPALTHFCLEFVDLFMDGACIHPWFFGRLHKGLLRDLNKPACEGNYAEHLLP